MPPKKKKEEEDAKAAAADAKAGKAKAEQPAITGDAKADLGLLSQLPPPFEKRPPTKQEEYKTGIGELREAALEARRKEHEFDALEKKFQALEAKVDAEEAQSKKIEDLERKIELLEQDANPEIVNEDDLDNFWFRKRNQLLWKLEDAHHQSGRERALKQRFQRQVYLGESVETKMEFRMLEIERDNLRLRKLLRQKTTELEEIEKVRPIREYISTLGFVLNQHDERMTEAKRELDALAVPANYLALAEGEDVLCGSCRMRVAREERGVEHPHEVVSRLETSSDARRRFVTPADMLRADTFRPADQPVTWRSDLVRTPPDFPHKAGSPQRQNFPAKSRFQQPKMVFTPRGWERVN
ncbi:hypothetical protein DIPPA_00163 [Diplonema papillatum]|nr:hypothetical protein DIPPA_00163 [Diplonema papillatum]